MTQRVLAVLWIACCTGSAAAGERPNIIFILADDLSYGDVGRFGQKHYATPNIDRLASEGRVFTNAYAGGTWCAPSRTALMTGRHAAHFDPVEHDDRGRATKFNPTVAQMLGSAGYATGAMGKWHMFEGGSDSWQAGATWAQQKAGTNRAQMPWNRGFEVCRIGYRGGFEGSNGNPYFPFQIETGDHEEIALPQNHDLDAARVWLHHRNPGETARQYDEQGRFVDKTGKNSSQLRYAEDLYREEAVAFMRTNAEQHKPFFLYYATPLIHGPLMVKELGRFRDAPADWTWSHKLWAAMVEELDRSVGVILDEVKRLGIEDNTIILFASDNGYSQWGYFPNRQRWSDDPLFRNKGPWNRGKFMTTNGGVIVPFIAWGPGRVPAGKTDRAINFYDFMATAGELAGAETPGPTDGVSFVPLLEGRDTDQPLRAAMLWPKEGNLYNSGIPDEWASKPSRTVYMPDAVLLDEKWYALILGDTVRLFDITADPGMREDRSSAHPELCDRARAAYDDIKAPAGLAP